MLVVDDNSLNQQIITAMVTGFGHQCKVAKQGMMAIEKHEKNDFDLILMDVRMPVLSGPEATRMIRLMDGSKAKIPIIALTADALQENGDRYLEAGMNDVVVKPIDRNELALAINKALGEEIHRPSFDSPSDLFDQHPKKGEPELEAQENAVEDFLKTIQLDRPSP